ncbi:hypothetical protein [Methanobrevibacter sp.]|nr:hypothetical protein [Methanobrevibacter sp.]MDO5824353.1 hypothetical protein [Methanobrevibacter sp.]
MGKREYEINVDKLKDFYEEFKSLEDWIPHMILMYLPSEVALAIGSEVKK